MSIHHFFQEEAGPLEERQPEPQKINTSHLEELTWACEAEGDPGERGGKEEVRLYSLALLKSLGLPGL